MQPYNWKEFTKRIDIAANAAEIYKAWSTQDGLESWFLRLAAFTSQSGVPKGRQTGIEAGDQYKWLWFGYNDNTFEKGRILAANGKDEMSFTFSGGCIVTVTIRVEGKHTVCTLHQAMPMDNEAEQQNFYIECGQGWTFYLANLKSKLEGGVDLRNKDEVVKNVINS